MTVETTAPQAQKTMMVPLPNKSPGEPITVRSMTGYARVSGHVAETEFVVDISSLNHRHADVNVTLPAALQGLDVLLRKQVRERVLRGRVRLGISIKRPLNCSRRLQLNLDRAEQYLSYHQTLRDTFGLEGSLDATTLLNAPLVVDVIEDELADEPVTDALRSAVSRATESLLEMQDAEGRQIGADIGMRLGQMRVWVDEIEPRVALVPDRIRRQLEDRIEALGQKGLVSEDRLAQEILFHAERADVTEEIVRMRSHLDQMTTLLAAGGETGLKLDFLCQELGREINTTGTKGSDSTISKRVVDFKAELAKVREQVQNLV